MLFSGPPDAPTLADVLPNCLAAMGVAEPAPAAAPGAAFGEQDAPARSSANSGASRSASAAATQDAPARPVRPLGLPPVRGVVVVLVDGLGAEQLRARSGHARALTRAWDGDELHSFPSTTVAGITSLTTASSAGEHGLLAYTVWHREHEVYLNQLTDWGEHMPPATWQLRPTVFERAPGVDAVVVSMPEYRTSGLTRASLRGAEYRTGSTMLERSEAAIAAAHELPRPLVYLYHAELDQVGHAKGWQSQAWTIELERFNESLEYLLARLPTDIGVLVVADHGMVDVPVAAQRDLDLELLRGAVAMAGEPRLRHIYLPEAAGICDHEAFAAKLRQAHPDALVLTREQALASGWYGPVVPEAARRMGDVLLVATGDYSFFFADTPANKRHAIGQHGALTPAETRVPLVRLAAFSSPPPPRR